MLTFTENGGGLQTTVWVPAMNGSQKRETKFQWWELTGPLSFFVNIRGKNINVSIDLLKLDFMTDECETKCNRNSKNRQFRIWTLSFYCKHLAAPSKWNSTFARPFWFVKLSNQKKMVSPMWNAACLVLPDTLQIKTLYAHSCNIALLVAISQLLLIVFSLKLETLKRIWSGIVTLLKNKTSPNFQKKFQNKTLIFKSLEQHFHTPLPV